LGIFSEVRATIPLAVKALTVAVRELMVIAEQKDAPADDEDSSESEEEEIQDEMKTLLVIPCISVTSLNLAQLTLAILQGLGRDTWRGLMAQ